MPPIFSLQPWFGISWAIRPDALDILVGVFAADCEKLIHEGITSSDGTKHVYLLHLATKGDLPALSKLGSFERSFSHVPKAASSRSASVGICHYCLGGQESNNRGQEHVPYEDFSLQPRWLPTMYTTDPWSTEPTIFSGLPLDQSRRAQFFESDIWHNLHLGCLKHWGGGLASVSGWRGLWLGLCRDLWKLSLLGLLQSSNRFAACGGCHHTLVRFPGLLWTGLKAALLQLDSGRKVKSRPNFASFWNISLLAMLLVKLVILFCCQWSLWLGLRSFSLVLNMVTTKKLTIICFFWHI